jgi:glycine oxidase
MAAAAISAGFAFMLGFAAWYLFRREAAGGPASSSGVARLLGAATALVPELAGATFTGARAGLRPGSPDELPYVGHSVVAPGLVYACGHYRNGALLAPLTARLVAALVTGDATDAALADLSPGRAGRL